jgi:hypothetical protein
MAKKKAGEKPVPEKHHECAREVCKRVIKDASGLVPGLTTLFRTIRDAKVQKSEPLTRAEVLVHELCRTCAKLATFEVYPTNATLALMDRWARENVERKENALEVARKRKEAQAARSLKLAIETADRHPINRLLAETKGAHVRKGKGGRLPRAERRELAEDKRAKVRSRPEASEADSSNKKPNKKKGNKKDKDEKGGKRK